MTFGSLFAGIGGLDLGLERAGMECKWQIEIDPFCRGVLAKHWPKVKRYGDITTVGDGELESVDLVAGGFPCQPVSLAGARKAQGDERWLWPDFHRIVRMVRPRCVLVENVPGLLAPVRDDNGRIIHQAGMGEVLGDLAASGYDAEWDCIPACALGAPHIRYRVFIVAYVAGHGRGTGRAGRSDSGNTRQPEQPLSADFCHVDGEVREQRAESIKPQRTRGRGASRCDRVFADSDFEGLAQRQEQVMLDEFAAAKRSTPSDPDGEPLVRAAIARGERHAWTVEPGVVRMVHGVSDRVDRIHALGNAVVPQVAEWIGLRIIQAERGGL